MTTTAQAIIDRATADIGVRAQGETLSAADSQDAFARLNSLVNSWGTQPLTMPFIARQVFHVVANQANYTMGPGGDFDTSRPLGLTNAGLLLNSSSPPVEIPRGLLTDDAWASIPIKDLSSLLWTDVYFNATYANDRATVTLWPVPTTAQNDCVLYRRDVVQGFADLTTAYVFPYGYADALEYQLALRLMAPYGRAASQLPDVVAMARQSLALIKRGNYTLVDLPTDPALTSSRRGAYNIETGTGGGAS